MMLISQLSELSEIIGQDIQIKKLEDFITNFKNKKKNAIIIIGPSGTGKTSTIRLLSKELNLELIELNASNNRSSKNVESIVGNAIKQQSLFFKNKIIFLDEIDGLSGNLDRGGIKTIIELIENSKFPIILSCNDSSIEKIEPLLKKSEIIVFIPLDSVSIQKILQKTCDLNNINYKKEDLKLISQNSNGDARAAITDLQMMVINKELKINQKLLNQRTQNEENNVILENLFYYQDPEKFSKSLFTKNIELFDISQTFTYPIIFGKNDYLYYWIEENTPRIIPDKNLSKAFNLLSKSDVFMGRIRRWQHWGLLVYSSALISGITVFRKENNKVDKFYKTRRSPKENFRLWGLINKRRKIIAEKIAEECHISSKKATQEILPYIKIIFKKGKGYNLGDTLNLSKEEIVWLEK